jgi:hypothetical protein
MQVEDMHSNGRYAFKWKICIQMKDMYSNERYAFKRKISIQMEDMHCQISTVSVPSNLWNIELDCGSDWQLYKKSANALDFLVMVHSFVRPPLVWLYQRNAHAACTLDYDFLSFDFNLLVQVSSMPNGYKRHADAFEWGVVVDSEDLSSILYPTMIDYCSRSHM